MKFFDLRINPRDAQYARLTAEVQRALQQAVELRIAQGETKTSIAKSLGCHRSVLTRVLNGNVTNLTLRTISDILWATQHEPDKFRADPYELISKNYVISPKRNVITANLLPPPDGMKSNYILSAVAT